MQPLFLVAQSVGNTAGFREWIHVPLLHTGILFLLSLLALMGYMLIGLSYCIHVEEHIS